MVDTVSNATNGGRTASATTAEQGEILSNLSAVLFSEASGKWYLAAATELLVGVASALLLLIDAGNRLNTVIAIIGFSLYCAAYALRLRSESQYAQAETMRRQAALSEALAWKLSQTQYSLWRQRAGTRVLKKLKTKHRPDDYYATVSTDPTVKLSHMTTESAFFTRHLYGGLSNVLWWAALVAVMLSISSLATAYLFGDRAPALASAVLAILMVLISTDILGWAIRLRGMTGDIYEIERDFERLGRDGDPTIESVMRLVGEYNCVVVGGIPIHRWWFDRHHDPIRDEWSVYIRGSGGLPGPKR